MALRIALIVRTEFLRLVLRQLLRGQVGVEIVGEAAEITAALRLSDVTQPIVERALCDSEPEAFATLCRRHPGRILLIGDGAALTVPAGVMPGEVTLVPAGTAAIKLDLSVLGSRLDDILKARRRADPLPGAGAHPMLKIDPGDIPPRRIGRGRRPALVGIAASTGGPEALQDLLLALDPPVCPIVVALHIPEEHTAGLARHLGTVSGHTVVVGEAGPMPERAIILLKGGADHAVVATARGLLLRRVRRGASMFHPNADILLTSIAEIDRPVAGVVLTGMGTDGCKGALALASRGHPVFAQRPSNCVVSGMPEAAIATGAVTEIAVPAGIAARLNEWFALPE